MKIKSIISNNSNNNNNKNSNNVNRNSNNCIISAAETKHIPSGNRIHYSGSAPKTFCPATLNTFLHITWHFSGDPKKEESGKVG